jgi:hypothetical protein
MRLRSIAPAVLACVLTAPSAAQGARGPDGRGVVGGEAEVAIRARRESSNRAIAVHDTAGIGAILAGNVVVVTSNSAHVTGRNENVARFADQFRTRTDVVYRRTPDVVSVFAPWQMASEQGRWTGSWTDMDGRVSIGGTYFAKWRRTLGAWFVESETYVPDRCTGGRYCRESPAP